MHGAARAPALGYFFEELTSVPVGIKVVVIVYFRIVHAVKQNKEDTESRASMVREIPCSEKKNQRTQTKNDRDQCIIVHARTYLRRALLLT